jgi:conflict system STAND superfamily ATPase
VTGQQIEDLIRRLLRASRNEILSLVAGVSGTLAGTLYSRQGCSLGFWVAAGIAAASGGWLTLRMRRINFGQPPSADAVTPIAARGLAPYNKNDHALFWRLGRTGDIRRLVAQVHDTNSSIIVLHGEDGAGKSSLLWAGLKGSLEQEQIQCVYCDAATTDPVRAAAGAVLADLKLDVGRDLKQLAAIQARTVLIIDSFESIDRSSPEHEPFPALLSSLHDQAPPHLFQLIVAFRDYYKPAWLEIEQKVGARAAHVSLGLLNADTANNCMETILEEADVNVDRAIIRDYIQAATALNGVSPVDIGIGAQIFVTWANRLARRHLRFSDYVSAGGTRGVLMAHVQERLDSAYVFEQDRAALLYGLGHGLVDKKTAGRDMGGMSAPEFAAFTHLDLGRVHDDYLPDLAARDTRILEVIPGENPARYRLARESLVRIVTQLDQETVGTAKNTHSFFLDHYERWKKSQSKHDLLRGDLLKLAVDHAKTIRANNIELNDYINKSRAAQKARLGLIGLSAAVTAALAIVLVLLFGANGQETRLSSWLLPPEIYQRQVQMKTLRIKGYSVTELGWLKHLDYRTFEITDSRLSSVAGLSNPRSIEDLTVDLTGTPIDSLSEIAKVPGLTNLTLYLGRSRVQELTDLGQATKLSTLSLNLGGSLIRSVAELSKMTKLRSLTLRLAGSSVQDLTPLANITGLETLKIDLDSSQFGMIADITKATNLHDLTLTIENPRNRRSPPDVRELPSLGAMEGLRKLTLILKAFPDQQQASAEGVVPPIGNLSTLTLPGNLRELNIDLGGFPVAQLPELGQVENLQHLGLHVQGTGLRRMPDLTRFRELQDLDLSVDGPQALALKVMKLKDLQSLSLEIQGQDVSTFTGLADLKALRKLTLDLWSTDISSLSDLVAIHGLRELELHLKWSQIEKLPSLAALDELNSLAISVIGEAGRQIPPLDIRHDLLNLALSFSGSSLDRLPDLTQFKGVRRLALYIAGSKIQTLDSLTNVGTLKSLVLDVSDTQLLHELPDLRRLHELAELTLVLDGSQIQSLPDLSALKGLTTTVSLGNSRISRLQEVQHLGKTQELTVDQRCHSLQDLPESVERITFSWRQ